MCVDRNQRCRVDGLCQFFKIEKGGIRSSCSFIGDSETPFCREILKKLNVDQHIEKLVQEEFLDRTFRDYIRWLSIHYVGRIKIVSFLSPLKVHLPSLAMGDYTEA